MSDHDSPKPEPTPYEPKVIGLLAEFSGPDALIDAARAIREKGYRKVEAFSPFPIHGIDDALQAPKPTLPWVVFGAGLSGCIIGILMQWYMNAFEEPIPFSGYDYLISGKPSWSLPANIPVTFELTILFSAFTAFFGMIAFNALPKLSNPLFRNERFRKATDNKFFLLVESSDAQFAEQTVTSAFEEIGAEHVEPLFDQQDQPMPSYIVPIGAVLTVAALVPLAMVAMSRGGTSQTPRLSIWWDMDYQPKYKAQTQIDTSIFPDGRADRPPVSGTVSRSSILTMDALHLGYPPDDAKTFATALFQGGDAGDASETKDEEETASSDEQPGGEEKADDSAKQDDAEKADADEPSGEEAEDKEEKADTERDSKADADAKPEAGSAEPAAAAPAYVFPWVTKFPIEIDVDMKTMERGRQRYNIYCAVCHGRAGDGDGLVSQRATELQQSTWRPPTNLHQANIVAQPVGKLYDTITNGNLAGKNDRGGIMRGGMPGYKEQIALEDRWAIVLYVKALQKMRTASPDELTEQELAKLK